MCSRSVPSQKTVGEKVKSSRVGSAKLVSVSERNIGAVAYPGASE